MKKALSVMVAAGVITALSVSAFAAEGRCAPNGTMPVEAESRVTEIAEGLDPFATVEDKFGNGESKYSGVLLVEDGGEYVAELGEGMRDTDVREDPACKLVPPARQ